MASAVYYVIADVASVPLRHAVRVLLGVGGDLLAYLRNAIVSYMDNLLCGMCLLLISFSLLP